MKHDLLNGLKTLNYNWVHLRILDGLRRVLAVDGNDWLQVIEVHLVLSLKLSSSHHVAEHVRLRAIHVLLLSAL